VVSTEGPISASVAAVSEVVFRALAARRGW
jgi:hypothetical protein